MCEKGIKMVLLLSKNDEGKKSVLLGENLWTANGKDSTLWSLLAKYEFSIICKKFYSITPL